jgi:integrase
VRSCGGDRANGAGPTDPDRAISGMAFGESRERQLRVPIRARCLPASLGEDLARRGDHHHRKGCATERDRRCNCQPGYRAEVFSARDGRKLRKTFSTPEDARRWRAGTETAIRDGRLIAKRPLTFRKAAQDFLDGIGDGSIRNRSGDRYKPSAIRSYEIALRTRLVPALGAHKLADIRRADLQRLVARWLADGQGPSTIRNTLNAACAIYRHAVANEQVAVNPTTGLQLPAVRGRRERVVAPFEAAVLIAALPEQDQALWATFFYTGLRLGEARALRWQDVDLAAGVIRVERGWDPVAGPIDPKSSAGRRVVPISAVVRTQLVARKLAAGRGGLVFARADGTAFNPKTVIARARRAWKAAGLNPITPHEARHSYASLMIAAGVNAKTHSTYMGHANIAITLDRYGHLMPGAEHQAAAMLDAYLNAAAATSS